MHGIKFESFAKFIFDEKIHLCVDLSVCNICTYMYICVYICIYIYVQKRLYHRPIVLAMNKAQ